MNIKRLLLSMLITVVALTVMCGAITLMLLIVVNGWSKYVVFLSIIVLTFCVAYDGIGDIYG